MAEWERARVPDGYRDVTAGMTRMFRRLIPGNLRGVSFKVLPKRLLPAPGVCVTETRNIYIAHDLVQGITAEDFSEPEALLTKRARTLGVAVHEVMHARYSPLNWADWIKGMRAKYADPRVVTTAVAMEEVRIESKGVKGGSLTPAERLALAETTDELIARELLEEWKGTGQ